MLHFSFRMAPAGLETAAGSPSVWRGRPLGELSSACSRAGANTIGSATIELPGGGRIDFRSQPASFVAACAAELGLVSTSTAAVPQRERAEDKAVSSAPTAASKRRKRRKATTLQSSYYKWECSLILRGANQGLRPLA